MGKRQNVGFWPLSSLGNPLIVDITLSSFTMLRDALKNFIEGIM